MLLYAAAVWLIAAAFVHWYEEPTLTRRFGADYEAYRRAVPACVPGNLASATKAAHGDAPANYLLHPAMEENAWDPFSQHGAETQVRRFCGFEP